MIIIIILIRLLTYVNAIVKVQNLQSKASFGQKFNIQKLIFYIASHLNSIIFQRDFLKSNETKRPDYLPLPWPGKTWRPFPEIHTETWP